MTNPINLTAGTFVTAAGWSRAYEFNTTRNYCGERAHEASKARGEDTAWTINPGSAITSDRAANARRAAEEAAKLESATVLSDGQLVIVDGETFVVRLMGQNFSDPIHFKAAQ